MDTACVIRQQYASALQGLEKIIYQRQRKDLEKQFNEQVAKLLDQIQEYWRTQLSQVHALTVLFQECGLMNEGMANAIRAEWQQRVIRHQTEDALRVQDMNALVNSCGSPEPDLNLLPSGSWFLQFKFTLAKPYISHDDEPYYLIDNPVTKDMVFGLPLVRPSSWKGNLRSVLRLCKGWNDDAPEMIRLFGNPKRAESDFNAGRLEFYPSFFYRIGLEIINPHDRARRVGKNPILLECVPAGAQGTFSLLYVPFDLIGQADAVQQAQEDLQRVAEAVREMMLTYGFSAKRSSGYGTAKDEIVGKVRTRADEKTLTRLSQLAQEVQNVRF